MAEIRAAHRAGPMVGDVVQAIDWTNGEDVEVGYEPDEYVAEPRWDPVTGYEPVVVETEPEVVFDFAAEYLAAISPVSVETPVVEDDDDEPVVVAVKRGPGRPRKVQ
ncbi:hypothetical protein [Caudoviricetes sp.]|nr:hypothetical protein [Caudoviricetes sp.]